MNTFLRRFWRLVVAAGLLGLSVSASAATYYVRVAGTPSSIQCFDDHFTFGTGAQFQWSLASLSSQVQGSRYINGAFVNSSTSSPGALSGNTSGSADLSVVNSTITPYPPVTSRPYTVSYVVQPLDADTEGFTLSWTCLAGGGFGNFTNTVIPAQQPVLQASPANLGFPATVVGGASTQQTATISNTGPVAANGLAIANSNSADFTIAGTTCGAVLAGNSSCTISVVFNPTATGNRTGTVTVTGTGVSTSFTMSGTGTGQLMMFSPLVFSAQTVGTTSAPSSVTVTNSGATTVTVASVTSSNPSEFAVTTTCTSIAPGAQCAINVTFTPSAVGQRTATITVTSNGTGSPQTINVLGNGSTPAGGQLSLQSSIAFGAQTVGTTSAATVVTVSNVGGSAVTVSGIQSSVPAEFAVSANTCATVQPGGQCTFSVTFTPAAAGARSATITVTSNGAGSPQAVNATGTGSSVVTPGQLSVPPTVVFGTIAVGTPSSPTVLTLTNTGGSPVTISGIASSAAGEFAVSQPNNCSTVAPGAQCVFSVTFTPAAPGGRSATITVTSSGVGSPQTINASGTGAGSSGQGQLAVDATLDVGSVLVGSTGAPVTVTIVNVSSAAVQVSSIGSSNPAEFAITQANCGTVAVGASCSFSFTFAPSAVGVRSATMTVVSNGIGSPQTVAVTGTGTATPPPATVQLIEYYHAAFDHYFITGIADEITKLDNGTFVGWVRTGLTFKGYPSGTAGTVVVCRFFSTSFDPKSSHFYTPFANECAIVKANPDWLFEGEVFNMAIPDINGVCQAGTIPIYRLYNNGQGAAPNHRYTRDLAVRAQMIAAGWIPEGYGPLGVIMCAPI